jgi:hypothetical protein
MREIAYTGFGGNALFAGLIFHFASILAGVMSSSGSDVFFKVVYPASWALWIAGGYAELQHRSIRPVAAWRFYLIAAVSVFPVLGPLIVLGLIYSAPEKENRTGGLTGLFPALLRLRANMLLIFVWILLLFLLFAFLHSSNDPYFKKRTSRGVPMQLL